MRSKKNYQAPNIAPEHFLGSECAYSVKSDNEDINDIKSTGTLEKTNWNNPIVLSLAKLILSL